MQAKKNRKDTPTPKPRPGPAPRPSKAPQRKVATKKAPKKAEPKKASAPKRKVDTKSYYRQQRIRAEETGDQKTVNKIYGKLGKSAPNVDANTTDKAILAAVATMSPALKAVVPMLLQGVARMGAGAGAAGAMGARMPGMANAVQHGASGPGAGQSFGPVMGPGVGPAPRPMQGPPPEMQGPPPGMGAPGGMGRPIMPEEGPGGPLTPSSGVRAPSPGVRPVPRAPSRPTTTRPTPVKQPVVRKGASAEKEMVRAKKALDSAHKTLKAAGKNQAERVTVKPRKATVNSPGK